MKIASAIESTINATEPLEVTKTIARRVYEYLRDANNTRIRETDVALRFLHGQQRILDVGCGTGNFIARDPNRIEGLDYNDSCVDICRAKGFKVQQGDARELPFPDNSFDGVYSAHVMHVFSTADAFRYMGELIRVTKPRGVVAICTIPDSRRAWIHAENARPYPPLAIRGMFREASSVTETAPTVNGLPTDVQQEAIWFRRPPLVDLLGQSSHELSAMGGILNGIQHRLLLRKYWDYDGYIIKLRNSEKKRLSQLAA